MPEDGLWEVEVTMGRPKKVGWEGTPASKAGPPAAVVARVWAEVEVRRADPAPAAFFVTPPLKKAAAAADPLPRCPPDDDRKASAFQSASRTEVGVDSRSQSEWSAAPAAAQTAAAAAGGRRATGSGFEAGMATGAAGAGRDGCGDATRMGAAAVGAAGDTGAMAARRASRTAMAT